MPTYKLYYFNAKARAELIRWIFAQAGVKYEDIRLDKEQWAKMKPDTPNGSLPVLDVDGQMLAGAVPIARYVAEQHGVAGANDLENAQIAGIDDLLTDVANRIARFWFEKDDATKAQMKKDLDEKHLPFSSRRMLPQRAGCLARV
jgi:glutathione S-transferase